MSKADVREADNDCDDQNDKREHGGCGWKSWNTKAEKKSSFRIKNQNKVADGVVSTVKSIFGQGDELFKICFNPAKNSESECLNFLYVTILHEQGISLILLRLCPSIQCKVIWKTWYEDISGLSVGGLSHLTRADSREEKKPKKTEYRCGHHLVYGSRVDLLVQFGWQISVVHVVSIC